MGWKILRDICIDRGKELIDQVPLPWGDKTDTTIFDEKGIFTVKSCNRKSRGECNMLEASFLRKVWSLKLLIK